MITVSTPIAMELATTRQRDLLNAAGNARLARAARTARTDRPAGAPARPRWRPVRAGSPVSA